LCQSCSHSSYQSRRSSFFFIFFFQILYIYFYHIVSFGYHLNHRRSRRTDNPYGIQVNGCSQHHSMLVIRMVAAHLASSGSTVYFYLFFTKQLFKLCHSLCVSGILSLCLVFILIDVPKQFFVFSL